jgi:hypothetical protein
MDNPKPATNFTPGDEIGSPRQPKTAQRVGYSYDVNLLPDYSRITPFLKRYVEVMGWEDLNWLEDVHFGYQEGRPAVFDRNINGWVIIPEGMKVPEGQQDRDMMARELLIKFQMSNRNNLLYRLKGSYRKF